MATYFGYMDVYDEYYNKYYNFYPLYIHENNKFIKIENVEELFPEHGNFAIYKNKYYDVEDKIAKREFFILDLDEDDIQENKKTSGEFNTSHFKINIEEIVNKDKIHSLSEFNIYPTVMAENDIVDFNNGKNIIFVEDSFPVNRYMTKTLLYHQGCYYGPFDLSVRTIDKKMYVNTKVEQTGYILDKYTIDEETDDDPIIYCEFHRPDKKIDFVFLDDSFKKETVDLITDEALLDAFTKTLSGMHLKNDSIPVDELPEAIKKVNSSPFIAVKGDEKITAERISRLKEMISNTKDFRDLSSNATGILSALFNDEEDLDELVDQIVKNEELLDKFQSHRIFKGKIEEEQEQLDSIKEEKAKIQEEISDINKINTEKVLESEKKKIEDLQTEKVQLENDIQAKQTELDGIIAKTNLSNNINDLKTLEREYDNRFKDVKNEIETEVTNLSKKASKIIFDDQFDKFIHTTLSNALAKYDTEDEENKYKSLAEKTINAATLSIKKDEVLEYIIKEIQAYRPKYSKNTVLNILICVSQGFLTIFSGLPGTGKTSICRILAHVLGLDTPVVDDTNKFTQRYLLVAVGRGWNSKRDLIGYYNPLSKRIEKNNSNLYDALKILNYESDSSKLPMFVLLDEANLSPMEYYWGDFVNICDTFSKKGNSSSNMINLGENELLHIPKTLRFLATINNDHTTETISPRLIDRAFVISLPYANYSYKDSSLNDFDDDLTPVSWDTLSTIMEDNSTDMTTVSNQIFKYIKAEFEKIKQSLSPRVEEDIIRYCSIAQNLFEEEREVDPSIVALDYAICQKAITKISGNGTEYREWLEELKDYCQGQSLKMTASQLERIISNGDAAMQYYQFFE